MDTSPPSSNGAALAKARPLRPRNAATLVIYDLLAGEPRLLMGRRHIDQIFLPGHYVFPGGRVDRGDRLVALASHLSGDQLAKLQLETAAKAQISSCVATSLAVAAVRETFEETGYLVGRVPGGEPPGTATWHDVVAAGFRPGLAELSFFARALTPPGRPRRYDTRFFAVSRCATRGPYSCGDGELEDVGWRSISEVRQLKLPSITRLVVEDFARWLESRTGNAMPAQLDVPFYFQQRGSFQRVVLSRAESAP